MSTKTKATIKIEPSNGNGSANGLELAIEKIKKPTYWAEERKRIHTLLDEIRKRAPQTNILDKIEKLIPDLGIITHVEITPEMAKDILHWNDENRPIPHGDVFRYANDMTMGKWVYNGDSIRISKRRKIIDGQTRLLAIIISGKPQRYNIQAGFDEKAYPTIDYGKKRTAGDVLAKLGYADHNILAAAVKQSIYFERQGRIQVNLQSNRVSNQDIVDWFKVRDVKLMERCVAETNEHHKKGPFLARSTWAFVHYTLSLRHRGQASEFCDLLASGAAISPTRHNAIYLLREKLMHQFPAQHQRIVLSGGSLVTELKIRYIFRAWNAWRNGEKLTALRINTKEPKIEKPV